MAATAEEVLAIQNWAGVAMRERSGLGTEQRDGCTFDSDDFLAMLAIEAPDAASAIRQAFANTLRPIGAPLLFDLGRILNSLEERYIGILMQAGAARFLPAVVPE